MNAVIGLCHFCELHGPSVLFCTQAFHDREIFSSFDFVPNKNFYGDETFLNSSSENSENKKHVCEREYINVCMLVVQQLSLHHNTELLVFHENSESHVALTKTCDSFSSQYRGFISNDHENHISYVSAKRAVQDDVVILLRQACFRSLSCEVTPAKEGAVFFGDDRGYVLSHTFSLKDAEARGFKRWFSIVMVMKDKYFLLNCWPFLVNNMKDIITELQKKTTEVYNEEQVACPQRAMRLSSLPAVEKKSANKFLRSFQDLTADPIVFARLHLWFTWLLKAGGVYLMEQISIGLLPRMDLVFEVEDKKDTEEGFAVISPASLSPSESDLENSLSCDSDQPLLAIRNVRQLHNVLGAHYFLCVAYCVMVGHQVVVRGQSPNLVASVISCLKLLVPRTCQRTIMFSDKYVPRIHCNLLGLEPGAFVPVEADVFLLEITYHHANNCDDLNNFCCDVSWTGSLPAKCPTILMKMEKAITNYNLHESVLEYYFFALKEEWLNIAKVLRKVQKSNDSNSDLTDLLSSLGAKAHDKALLDFWAAGVL